DKLSSLALLILFNHGRFHQDRTHQIRGGRPPSHQRRRRHRLQRELRRLQGGHHPPTHERGRRDGVQRQLCHRLSGPAQ
ncbi:hypothetical protein DFH09DRAFT_1368464, partial [Mycena vulgaris]